MSFSKTSAYQLIEQRRDFFCIISDAIWEHPETAFTEFFSAQALCTALEQCGFSVERNAAGIETAFVGTYGSGKPVIGVLGEFDALSGLSQTAGRAEQLPLNPGGNGHGCGHNLLGVGSLAACVAIKEYLAQNHLPGTVKYFGCPGEEGGSGKTFMARDGVFNGLDAAISWHPMETNNTLLNSTLANVQIIYRFSGVSAHAAAMPWLGRSALDALELMNTGIQFLREHVTPDVRMHYAILDAGGQSPNVVQAKAEGLYLLRGKDTATVQDLYDRVTQIAQGAAMMTGTSVETEFVKGCSSILPNRVLTELIHKNMCEAPLPAFTDEDRSFAAAIIDSIPPQFRPDPNRILSPITDSDQRALIARQISDPLYEFITPLSYDETALSGSTDVGDVSWLCPTAQANVVTMASCTPAHSWQLVAQGKSHAAHEGCCAPPRSLPAQPLT